MNTVARHFQRMFTQHPLYHQLKHELLGQIFHYDFPSKDTWAYFRDSQENKGVCEFR